MTNTATFDSVEEKAMLLSDRMNSITDKLTQNLDIAEELNVEGDEIVQMVQTAETNDTLAYTLNSSEIINLKNMVHDFQYIRSTLKENADNGRRVLNAITLELLEVDSKTNGNLVTSFAELNRAVADNMKLYITAYKDISSVLLNINKLKSQTLEETPSKTTKSNTSAMSTADVLKSF